MNFYAEQDDARKKTKYLVLLFVSAVLILTAITSVFVMMGFWVLKGQPGGNGITVDVLMAEIRNPNSQYFIWANVAKVGLWVAGTILCVIVFKWISLSGGGKKIAESLGGMRINPNTDNADEKRILNIVAEMALASGMPVPPVYLLAEEGINAFAAGNTPANAVIGITQGALDQLNRAQLQGVVAHEFSHILNGDMRLNLHLIAMLSGILFISSAGRLIMHAGGGGHRHHHVGYHRRRSGDARVLAVGLVLMALGWLGSLFARMIKAAISRQREFLADASSVQFTRNPQGIADALKIMGGYSGGSRLSNPNAAEASHMFIGNSQGPLELFATHPPLEDRIRKIEPRWNGEMIRRKIKPPASEELEKKQAQKSQQASVAAAIVTGAVLTGQAAGGASVAENAIAVEFGEIPAALVEMARDPFGACAVIFALLLDEKEAVQKKQQAAIKAAGVPGLSLQTMQLIPAVARMDKTCRLPLLELAMPALKSMSGEQYKVFKRTMMTVIRADNKIEMFEWCLYQVLKHYLAPEFEGEKTSKPRYKKASQVAEEYALVLSMLAHYGHQESKDVERAFGRGANTVGLYAVKLLPRDQCPLDGFIKAANKLADCYPLLKPKLLKGLVDCARLDGEITASEKEIVASIAAVIDCPAPKLIDS